MEIKADRSQALTYIFFISILLIDWLYIFSIQQQAPMINHWVVALPLVIPLFFSLSMLALIGIYLASPWGFVLAYLNIILSTFFSFISYNSLLSNQVVNDMQFIGLVLLNIIVFIYIVCFNIRSLSNNQSH